MILPIWKRGSVKSPENWRLVEDEIGTGRLAGSGTDLGCYVIMDVLRALESQMEREVTLSWDAQFTYIINKYLIE